MRRLQRIEYLVIHHSLTKDGQVVDWDAIRRYHIRERGWEDIGYHYGIEQVKGIYQLMRGRPETVQGAHCKEEHMNARSLGICVVGNYDLAPPPKPALDLLVELCAALCNKYKIGPERIVTHHQFATYKTCPGRKFPMDELRARVGAKIGR